MIAENLIDAFNNFNVDSALLFTPTPDALPSQSESFYIDREGNPISELKFDLLTSQAHDKILFTGHLGSGKSTELNRLAEDPEIKKRFLIVKYSVTEKLDIFNINSIDLLISLAVMIITKALESKLKLGKTLSARLNKWWNNVKKEIIEEKGDSVGMQISDFSLDLLAGIKMSHTIRNIVRKKVEPQVRELIDLINNIILVINASLPEDKQILVVIDDLEKIPNLEKARKLYRDTGLYLAQPRCKIVYTVPVALHHSPDFKEVVNTFGKNYTLPNIRLTNKDKPGSKNNKGYKLMKEFVLKRMKPGLIEADALEEAIKNSGGVAREMSRIMQSACRNAALKDLMKVTLDVVKSSVASIRNEFDRMLSEEHLKVLKKVQESNRLPGGDGLSLELLHSLSVLEYQNHERWCDVNPIILPLLKKR